MGGHNIGLIMVTRTVMMRRGNTSPGFWIRFTMYKLMKMSTRFLSAYGLECGTSLAHSILEAKFLFQGQMWENPGVFSGTITRDDVLICRAYFYFTKEGAKP